MPRFRNFVPKAMQTKNMRVQSYIARLNRIFGTAYNGLRGVRAAEVAALEQQLRNNSLPQPFKNRVRQHLSRTRNAERQRNAAAHAMRNRHAAEQARLKAAENTRRNNFNRRLMALGFTSNLVKQYRNNQRRVPQHLWVDPRLWLHHRMFRGY